MGTGETSALDDQKIKKAVQYLLDKYRQGQQLVPIISNAVRLDPILDGDFNQDLGYDEGNHSRKIPELSYIEHEFAQHWANSFEDDYPFSIPQITKKLEDILKDYPDAKTRIDIELLTKLNDHEAEQMRVINSTRRVAEYNHLARVAQYRQIIPEIDILDPKLEEIRAEANREYLISLKDYLLKEIAGGDETISDSLRNEVDELKNEYSFSDIVQEFGYPKFDDQYPDTLHKLAQLPIEIYITTSYFNFLERLLQAEGKKPQTRVYFYKNPFEKILPEHKDENIELSVNEPLVYHLYGYEQYPSSLILSEGDYLDFLNSVATDTDTQHPRLPHYIKPALTGSHLLILGYRLLSWDFRALFRSLANPYLKRRVTSVALQVDPKFEEAIQNDDRALKYIERYFKSADFTLVVSNTVDFVEALWQEWVNRGRPTNGT